MDEDELETGEQNKNSPASHLRPWQYKKGQSGNPSGRPKGISLKEYVKLKFASMTDDEREEFLNGIDKKVLWEMAESKPKQDTEIDASDKMMKVLGINYIAPNGDKSNTNA